MKTIKAYLAAPIFTERDRNFNTYLEQEILKLCPDIDLYLAQNNASINDKAGCANSADIYVGDITKLKESDLLITIMSGDLPPIGSSYEVAYFCGLCEKDPRKRIIALYDDSREASVTYSTAKRNAMISDIAENQFPYVNLLAIGFVKKWGNIYNNSQDLIRAVKTQCDIGFDRVVSGIYKITNLKNKKIYIGQSNDIYHRWQHYKNTKNTYSPKILNEDINNLGINYFKFEIIERCDKTHLDEREKYWIEYYDSYNDGYNQATGGNKHKYDILTPQCRTIYQYDLNGLYLNEFKSLSQAQRAVGASGTGDVKRCADYDDSHHHTKQFMWRWYKTEQVEPYSEPMAPNSKPIYSYDKQTRLFVKEFESAISASIELIGNRSVHICAVATGKRKSSLGYLWAYEKFDRLPVDYYDKFKQEDNKN